MRGEPEEGGAARFQVSLRRRILHYRAGSHHAGAHESVLGYDYEAAVLEEAGINEYLLRMSEKKNGLRIIYVHT
jgi:hypothetical protein